MIPQTGKEALPQFVSMLLAEYYEPLERLCDNINSHIEQFENRSPFLEHINYSTSLAGETKGFVEQRKLVFVPYLYELSEKSATGHDCANCSGGCDMQHTLKLMEFTDSLRKMQSTLAYIQREFVALERYKESSDAALTWLRSEVNTLGDLLDELLEKEDALIPDIQYAQKNINAHS